jgi:PadR family transcriptional regulator, regulatory protein PadR
MSRAPDLVHGTLGLLILKLLDLQSMHGWAISQHLKGASGGELRTTEASLYSALHRLEQDGWISGEWKPSANNRRAKFYSLTRAGRKHLVKETGEWKRLSSAVGRVMRLRTIEP